MSRERIPSCRLHKPSGQAVVRLDGKDHYLGQHGTPESREKYDRLIAEWLVAGRAPATGGQRADNALVGEVIARYWSQVTGPESPYWKAGKLTKQIGRIQLACRPLRELYGSLEAQAFSAKCLLAVRRHMAERLDWSRNFINSAVGCLKTMFDWAAVEGLVPGSVSHALRAVRGLRRGAKGVRDTPKVRAVPWSTVEATLPHLHPTARDMVTLQYLAGMRPCEVCWLRPQDLRFDGSIPDGPIFPGLWVYVVSEEGNKLAHKDKPRYVFLGARAQEIVRPSLARRRPGEFVFSPREAAEGWLRENGRAVRHGRRREPGERYTTSAYDHVIRAACRRAGVEPWAPNQLRHSRNTELRAAFGLATAGAVSGHESLETTLVYAEEDLALAAEAMQKIG